MTKQETKTVLKRYVAVPERRKNRELKKLVKKGEKLVDNIAKKVVRQKG